MRKQKRKPGRPAVLADGVRRSIQLERSVLRAYEQQAQREERPVSELLRAAIVEWIVQRRSLARHVDRRPRPRGVAID